MSGVLCCWHCGANLASIPSPPGRRGVCPACEADLHVCRMCRQMDPPSAKCCREPTVEEVIDKQRANFCDLFDPDPEAFSRDPLVGAHQAQEDLAALFGLQNAALPKTSRPDAQALLKQREDEAQRSRQALDELFNSDNN